MASHVLAQAGVSLAGLPQVLLPPSLALTLEATRDFVRLVIANTHELEPRVIPMAVVEIINLLSAFRDFVLGQR
jgi:hypothetical protein